MNRQILDISFWMAKRQLIKNSYNFNDHWKEIIERFGVRIEDFYFGPINRVKDPNQLKGEGFTILTIQCALIEMFAAFKNGKIHKYNKKEGDPEYTYRKADESFLAFLHSESIFENHFYTVENGEKLVDLPFSATDFYNQVRCGLMHEARTKGEWVINAKKTYKGDETVFLTRDPIHSRIRIDRTVLNNQLKKYFKGYLESLSQSSEDGQRLRRLFARKLDHLYDLPPDIANFDWWNDN